jgi:hypothetical protein
MRRLLDTFKRWVVHPPTGWMKDLPKDMAYMGLQNHIAAAGDLGAALEPTSIACVKIPAEESTPKAVSMACPTIPQHTSVGTPNEQIQEHKYRTAHKRVCSQESSSPFQTNCMRHGCILSPSRTSTSTATCNLCRCVQSSMAKQLGALAPWDINLRHTGRQNHLRAYMLQTHKHDCALLMPGSKEVTGVSPLPRPT